MTKSNPDKIDIGSIINTHPVNQPVQVTAIKWDVQKSDTYVHIDGIVVPEPAKAPEKPVYVLLPHGTPIAPGDEYLFDNEWCPSMLYLLGDAKVEDGTPYRRLITDPASEPGPLYRFLDQGAGWLATDELLIRPTRPGSFAQDRVWMPVYLATPDEKSKALAVRRQVFDMYRKPKPAPSITSRADYDAGLLKDTKIDEVFRAIKTLDPRTEFIMPDTLSANSVSAYGYKDGLIDWLENHKASGLEAGWDVYPPQTFTPPDPASKEILVYGRFKKATDKDWETGYLCGYVTDLVKGTKSYHVLTPYAASLVGKKVASAIGEPTKAVEFQVMSTLPKPKETGK